MLVFLAAVAALIYNRMQTRVNALEDLLRNQGKEQNRQALELERLRQLLASSADSQPAGPVVPPPPVAVPAVAPPITAPSVVLPVVRPLVVPPMPVVSVPIVPPVELLPEHLPAAAVPEAVHSVAVAPSVPASVVPEARPVAAALPGPPARPTLPPVPVTLPEPSIWERTSALMLENWTGILGAVILVTGVGFLGIYAALKVTPFVRFWFISGGAAALLGVRWALRQQVFAVQLRDWLQSSAAAIFLFACVGAASIPGLQWASGPLAYALLLSGVTVNLWLAWAAGREAVASLHAVLSLVALAVLPPSLLTLGAAASVTAFSVFVTYRQLWRWQLVLSIISFFAFHLYWHQQRPVLDSFDNGVALGLVLLVGLAAGLVQYRRIYAARGFEPVLFTAHLLNWTCLGLNLYLHSTGSVWKTIPLALGSVATFWAGRRARQLGLEWLFRTDTIISLLLALAAAFSLLAWQATPAVVLLFMLLETLLVAHVMAREDEPLVFQVALTGSVLAAAGLLVVTIFQAPMATPAALYRLAGVLAIAGTSGTVFCRFTAARRPGPARGTRPRSGEVLLPVFASQSAVLLAGVSLILALGLLNRPAPPVAGLVVALLAAGGLAFGLASWLGPAFGLQWLRQTLLAVAQFGVGLAILGLHAGGLSHAACWLLLYVENLAFQQYLRYRQEALAGWHVFTLLAMGALLLPIISSDTSLVTNLRAVLLLGAATVTAISRVVSYYAADEPDALRPSLPAHWPPYGFGWLIGGHLLAAASLLHDRTSWVGFAALAIGSAFLLAQRRWRLAGVAIGIMGALIGFSLLQWATVEKAAQAAHLRLVLLYLLPSAGLSAVALFTCYVPRQQHFVRQPWLYLLGIQLAAIVWLLTDQYVLVVLGWMLLAVLAFGAAQFIRQALAQHLAPPETLPAVLRHYGQPDRYLLHLAYALLFAATLLHFGAVLPTAATLITIPARYVSAAALLLTIGGLSLLPAPETDPHYRSWQYLHPWLLEATLALAAVTLIHEARAAFQPVVVIAVALLAEAVGYQLPPRLARLRAYGRLLYGLAALGAVVVCLARLSPARMFSTDWWAMTGVVLAMFGYAALALKHATDPNGKTLAVIVWPDGLSFLEPLLLPSYQRLVGSLLYPAFVVVGLLLIQSFDKALLTALLMVEVVAVFAASLLLRRADFRYTALAGMAACLVRLVFFDLRQSHTLARAAVFIFMGLLLLGMNALYARFKDRAVPPTANNPAARASDEES